MTRTSDQDCWHETNVDLTSGVNFIETKLEGGAHLINIEQMEGANRTKIRT